MILRCVAVKKHLHARWSINALIDCAKEQDLDLGNINTYETLFDIIFFFQFSSNFFPIFFS